MNGICRLEYCGRPIVVVGDQLCQTHYKQKRDGEPFRQVMPRGKRSAAGSAEKCAFPPCEMLARSMGYCNTHYLQKYRGRPLRMAKTPVPVTTRDADGNKWCGTCQSWLPVGNFARCRTHGDGLQTRCRDCNAAIYQARRELVRDKMREARFGITRERFDALLAEQGGACAICGATSPGSSSYWHMDHDHSCCPTDKTCGQCIRGILCPPCNTGLGHLRDDVAILKASIAYLDQHSRGRSVRAA